MTTEIYNTKNDPIRPSKGKNSTIVKDIKFKLSQESPNKQNQVRRIKNFH